MIRKIYVGNLPYQAEEQELGAWFNQNGFPVDSVSLMTDQLSGQPRGFGFVEMSEKLTDRCIRSCNGQDFLGRTLIINEAHPLAERRPLHRSGRTLGAN